MILYTPCMDTVKDAGIFITIIVTAYSVFPQCIISAILVVYVNRIHDACPGVIYLYSTSFMSWTTLCHFGRHSMSKGLSCLEHPISLTFPNYCQTTVYMETKAMYRQATPTSFDAVFWYVGLCSAFNGVVIWKRVCQRRGKGIRCPLE